MILLVAKEVGNAPPRPQGHPRARQMTLVQAAKCARFLHIFSAWYHGIFPNMAVNIASSILCAFRQCTHSYVSRFPLKDVRGVLASSFVYTLMVEDYGNSLGHFATSVNSFQGP